MSTFKSVKSVAVVNVKTVAPECLEPRDATVRIVYHTRYCYILSYLASRKAAEGHMA